MKDLVPNRDILFAVNHMLGKCLIGRVPILVLYTHGTESSIRVAILDLANVAALRQGKTREGELIGAYCCGFGIQVGQSPPVARAEMRR